MNKKAVAVPEDKLDFFVCERFNIFLSFAVTAAVKSWLGWRVCMAGSSGWSTLSVFLHVSQKITLFIYSIFLLASSLVAVPFFTKKCREARWYDLTFLSWLWFDIPKNIICREEQHHIFLIVRWACSHSSIQPPTTTNKWLYKRNGAVYMYKCSSSHPSIKHNNKFMKMFTWSDVPWFGVQSLDVVGMYPPRALYNNNDNSIKTKLLEW